MQNSGICVKLLKLSILDYNESELIIINYFTILKV